MRFAKNLGLSVLLIAGFVLAYLYGRANDTRETIAFEPSEKIFVFDGDSFKIGMDEYRLDAIDAPEYHQSCRNAAGKDWACGKAARASLETLLRQPGLICTVSGHDKFARAIAICQTGLVPDIAASQVFAGMALSDEFNGVKSYGREEKAARKAKRGIWQGTFIKPVEWRERNKPVRSD